MVLSLTLACAVSGCAQGKKHGLDPKKPTVITVWHAYNAFAKTKFDEKVTEFNETKGLELGIVVDAYGYGSSGNWTMLCLTPPIRLLDLTRFPMCLRYIRTAHTGWISWRPW